MYSLQQERLSSRCGTDLSGVRGRRRKVHAESAVGFLCSPPPSSGPQMANPSRRRTMVISKAMSCETERVSQWRRAHASEDERG